MGDILEGIFQIEKKFLGPETFLNVLEYLEAIKKGLESGPFLLPKYFKEVESAFSRDLVISCCVGTEKCRVYCLYCYIVATDY